MLDTQQLHKHKGHVDNSARHGSASDLDGESLDTVPGAPAWIDAISRAGQDLDGVDTYRVAAKLLDALRRGTPPREVEQLAIQSAVELIGEDPEYGKLAARLLAASIERDCLGQGLVTFSSSVAYGFELGLVNARLYEFAMRNKSSLDHAAESGSCDFEYFGLRTLYERYLLRHPDLRSVLETPCRLFLRVASALCEDIQGAIELYESFVKLEYLPSSPTLFNAGTTHEQLSSCFLLDSPADDLESIYRRYGEVARLTRYSGGVGMSYTRVRARGSLIRSTNSPAAGIVPWLKTLDASVAAVNQHGKRKGATCVYLEPWHADIGAFLELREVAGDSASRTYNLNLANWIPDLFMRRVEADEAWSLFDPKVVPELPDLWGEAFEERYLQAERSGLASGKLRARELYARMMRTLAQTGNGWMVFKDTVNRKCNQTASLEHVVHSSNLCTEIVQVTSSEEVAVCNLGSINLARHVEGCGPGAFFDFEKLVKTVRLGIRQLDRVVDLNQHTAEEAKRSSLRWRSIGLGVMGLQDVFFKLNWPFDAPAARALSRRISEEIYFAALSASVELAMESGPHPAFSESRAAQGKLQFDLWGVEPEPRERWDALRARIAAHGLRNSLLVAIAPTATIAAIAGCSECIEPLVSNVFKRETASGEFMQVNQYLVWELKQLGLWSDLTRKRLKLADGSIAGFSELPAEIRQRFRTAWEIPMRSLVDMAADRGPFIDQSQSLNLFVRDPTLGQLSSMYAYAWRRGLKSTYYLRSRPATRIAMTTVDEPSAERSCASENPTRCEACE